MCADLKFVMVNVQGLSGRGSNKLETDELRKVFKDNGIILFTETYGNAYTKFNVCNFSHIELKKKVKLRQIANVL